MLIGQMGSGKTSVMEGMCFALYGTFPSLKSRRITLDDVIMARPTGYSEASVEVKFDAQGKHFAVERIIRRGEALAYLREGGRVIESGPQRVTEAVVRLLKTDYELFTRAIYAEQNRVDAFLNLGRGERKKYFDELLGIHTFESARATSGAVLTKLKNARAQTQAYLEGADIAALQKEENTLDQRHSELEKSLQETSDAVRELEQRQAEAQQELSRLLIAEREYRALLQESTSAKSAQEELAALIAGVQKEIGRSYTRLEWEQEYHKIQKELHALTQAEGQLQEEKTQLEKLKGELAQTSADLTRLQSFADTDGDGILVQEAELARQEREIEHALSINLRDMARGNEALGRAKAHQQEAQALESQATQLVAKKDALLRESSTLPPLPRAIEEEQQACKREATLSAQRKQLLDALQLLSHQHASCPVCQSPLDAHRLQEISRAKHAELEEVESLLSSSRASMQVSKATLAKVQEISSAIEVIDAKIEATRTRLQQATQASAAAEIEARRAHELEAATREMQAALKSLNAQRTKLQETAFNAREYQRLSSRKHALSTHVQELATQFNDHVTRFDGKRKETLEEQQRVLGKAEQLFAWIAKSNELGERHLTAQSRLHAIRFSESSLSSARVLVHECDKHLAEYRGQRASMEREIQEVRTRLHAVRSKTQRASALQERMQVIDKRTQGVSKLQHALEETQGALRAELVASLNEAASALWPSMYPYGDYPLLRLTASEEDYALELQTLDGAWVSVETASGGERMCAALCLRVALVLVLSPHLGFMVLDEPTHNLDSTAVSMLSRALHDQLPRFVKQTFLITHDEHLKEGASARIYHVERDKDAGDKSVIEEMAIQ